MTAPVLLAGVGAALPSRRLPRRDVAAAWGSAGGRGEIGVCDDDEDVLTLAATAAGRALMAAGLGPDDVDVLLWGTSRPPFAEGPSHAVLAAALALPATSGGALLCGSPHAGMEALLAGWDAVAAGSARVALVVTADDRRPGPGTALEQQAGSGAAAVVLRADDGGDGPATLRTRATRTEPHLDRYRGSLEFDTRDVYDARLYREEVFLPAVTAVAAALGDADAWSLPDPDGRLGAAAAKAIGAAGGGAGVTALLGDTGAAAALLGALPNLAAPGDVAIVGHGGGRTSGVMVRVTAPVPGAGQFEPLLAGARPTSYAAVLRSRAQLVPNGESVAMAIPPGSALVVRGGREVLQLLGARCVDCGSIATPPSTHPHCLSCGGGKAELVPLARSGTVHTFVVNHTMPAPFVAPLPLAVLDLDDGARLMLQVCGAADDLAVGDRVNLVLRRYAVERGAPVYGYKALREA